MKLVEYVNLSIRIKITTPLLLSNIQQTYNKFLEISIFYFDKVCNLQNQNRRGFFVIFRHFLTFKRF